MDNRCWILQENKYNWFIKYTKWKLKSNERDSRSFWLSTISYGLFDNQMPKRPTILFILKIHNIILNMYGCSTLSDVLFVTGIFQSDSRLLRL